jgi:hypothetical protein
VLKGTAGNAGNIPISLTAISDVTNYALSVKNLDAVNGRSFRALDSSGGVIISADGTGVAVKNLIGGLTITTGGLTITSGGLTVTSGNVVITAGNLTFGTAVSVIVPGATSINFNNNANSATNLTITDGGLITIGRSRLSFTPAVAIINGGATSMTFNDNSNANTNLTIADAGTIVIERGALTFTPTAAIVRGGATSFNINNNANSATNLAITDAGAITLRTTGIGARVAGDVYLIMDAAGHIHQSAIGPAS